MKNDESLSKEQSLNELIKAIPDNFSFKRLSPTRRLCYKNLFDRVKNNDKLIFTYFTLFRNIIDSAKIILIDYPEIELSVEKEINKFNSYDLKFSSLKNLKEEIYNFFNPANEEHQQQNFLSKQRLENKGNLKLRLLQLILEEFFVIFPSADKILVPSNFREIKKLFFLSKPEKLLKLQKADQLISLLNLIKTSDEVLIDNRKDIFKINAEKRANFQQNLGIIADAINEKEYNASKSPLRPLLALSSLLSPQPSIGVSNAQKVNSPSDFLSK